jgi:signal peptidase II
MDRHPPALGRLRCLLVALLALGLFGCDHATKIAAKATLEGASAIPIAPHVLRGAVELRYAANDDIAFSAFDRLGVPHPATVLIGVALLAVVGIVVMAIAFRRQPFPDRDRMAPAGFAFILGGALGNVVDRIARGYVVDFIHVKGWPIFNVADIAVCVGVGLMVLSRIRQARERRRLPRPSS